MRKKEELFTDEMGKNVFVFDTYHTTKTKNNFGNMGKLGTLYTRNSIKDKTYRGRFTSKPNTTHT